MNKQQIINDYCWSSLTVLEIAAKYKTNVIALREITNAHGVKRIRKNRLAYERDTLSIVHQHGYKTFYEMLHTEYTINGKSSADIAEMTGRSKDGILLKLRRYNIPRKPHGGARQVDTMLSIYAQNNGYTNETECLFDLYYVRNLNDTEIAKKLGTGNASTVCGYRKKYGMMTMPKWFMWRRNEKKGLPKW